MPSAQVHALQRLAEFKAAVQTFTDKAKDAMSTNAMEIRRSQDWLEGQLAHWKAEIRRAEEEVFVARNELTRRKMMRIGENRVDTTEQEKLLRRALAKLAALEEKRDNTKRWIRQWPDAIEEYDGQARPFQDMLEHDMAKMLNFLEQKLAALEAYQRSNPASGGAS
jgi:chromosome segregation ATPase